jgi:CDP-glucose 4,6-dehydratase
LERASVSTFWQGRRVLVTGHTGFKGAWLAYWLHTLGAEVHGFSSVPPSEPNLFEQAELGELVATVHGDVLDASLLREVAGDLRPQFVFHLAAQPLVRASYRDALGTMAVNTLGTANLLDALRGMQAEGCLCVTSDKCYAPEPVSAEGYVETDRLGGNDPYSASKACAELVVESWRHSFGDDLPPVATARAGNVIGGGDWGSERLLPDAVRATQASEALVLRNPNAVRPWQHVIDVLRGYLVLAEHLVRAPDHHQKAYNFGPTQPPTTVKELVQRFYSHLGRGSYDPRPAPGQTMPETTTLLLNPARAAAELGWVSHIELDTAVRLTATWYRAWLERPTSARALMQAQIMAHGRP